jgi:hypothetical protein
MSISWDILYTLYIAVNMVPLLKGIIDNCILIDKLLHYFMFPNRQMHLIKKVANCVNYRIEEH